MHTMMFVYLLSLAGEGDRTYSTYSQFDIFTIGKYCIQHNLHLHSIVTQSQVLLPQMLKYKIYKLHMQPSLCFAVF